MITFFTTCKDFVGSTKIHQYNASAGELLGWEPKILFKKGLLDTPHD